MRLILVACEKRINLAGDYISQAIILSADQVDMAQFWHKSKLSNWLTCTIKASGSDIRLIKRNRVVGYLEYFIVATESPSELVHYRLVCNRLIQRIRRRKNLYFVVNLYGSAASRSMWRNLRNLELVSYGALIGLLKEETARNVHVNVAKELLQVSHAEFSSYDFKKIWK